MSGESLPIAPAAFAEAIKELTLPVLYAKVSEIRNSIAHLHRSNLELRTFVNESCETESDKRELEGYIVENEGVLVSMTERIALLKAEVEARGQQWIELEEDEGEGQGQDQDQGHDQHQREGQASAVNGAAAPAASETPADSQADQDEEGVYL
ncbi:hypothetical protein BO70DRAFT_362232 [Aspergillus heteromorphus CBS 117.55]|uniref:Uncharacterized protein n=1 Tax=Aspergillus heteromorphus CBS 117.55 TaxID=1448321 RepID=A0A317W967_9EURO|nr:uncharacterized protein BO70DRAFT_362232 [Aspergillus heteromorphus CBS 117.55]PWY81802.1 hypothetical protein BO70DRAFT_362232 [Aspergillus heteromorphus CBS 117.55]